MKENNYNYAFSCEDVSIAYRDVMAVADCDINISKGTMTAIIGPNGAGKSTLLKGALGLCPLICGQYLLFGKPFEDVMKRVAYVPQTDSVNWDFPATVEDVSLMGRYVHRGWCKRCTKKDKEISYEALEIMGMQEFAKRQISELSGGQRQRVFLARALAQKPELFLLDEPLTGIDKKTENLIIKVLKEYQSQGKTIIAVHHDLSTVDKYFDHVVLMDKTIKFQGETDKVFTPENIQITYKGYQGQAI